MPTTGADGELADLLDHFPELDIRGEFKEEYGSGSVWQTQQEYEEDEDEDETR